MVGRQREAKAAAARPPSAAKSQKEEEAIRALAKAAAARPPSAAAYAYAWLDGRFLRVRNATVPITTHALHYGTSVFEGMRAYWSRGQLYVFRLGDHVRRFRASGAHYNMSLPYTDEKIAGAVAGLCRRNQVRESCYIRPFYFVGEYGINLNVTEKAPVRVAAVLFPVGDLFDKGGITAGIVRCRKFSDASTPTQAKMGGNYLNAVLATQQARSASYDEAIMLDAGGNVSEAPGENVFVVKGGRLATPPASSSALMGITRASVLEFAAGLGHKASERTITRRQLAGADEVFLTGTAAEITPVVSIGGRAVGSGRPGPVTRRIMKKYGEIVTGRDPSYARWLTAVYE